MGYPYSSGDIIYAQDMNNAMFSMVGERSGGYSLGVGLAFGNGGTYGRCVVPVNCRLMFASLAMNTGGTGTLVVTLLVDGVLQSTTITRVGAGATTIDLSTGTPVTLSAGQGFNWEATTVSGTMDTTTVTTVLRQI